MTAKTKLSTLLAAALMLVTGATSALAHDDATLDAVKASNGGQVRMAGIYHYELVVAKEAKEPLRVFVTDHAGQKIATAGASGTATILSGKQKSVVALQPDGDNRLKGMTPVAATPDMKVVVSITLAGQQPEQARFTPLALTSDAHADHKH